jgi:8-oxo-dGTP pyrophosphatase MutT (NUDIX family)
MARPSRACHHGPVLNALLTSYQATGDTEAADLTRMTRLAASARDPWSRSLPLHFTASALVVHPATSRVLLRWHVKHGLWLQVGGHADPGESDPLRIALREATEETGLADLAPWPDGSLLHAVVCHVRASGSEPEHEHADLRYVLATRGPDAISPENEQSPLRWLTLDQARALVGGNNLRHTLDRTESLFERGSLGGGGRSAGRIETGPAVRVAGRGRDYLMHGAGAIIAAWPLALPRNVTASQR